MELRPYQREAVEAVYRYLRGHDDNPVVVIPTGGGKTPVMATLCDDAVTRWAGRVIVLAHVKELLEQTAGTLRQMAPHLNVGIYSAGLRRRDTEHAVIVAGIQSAYRRAAELDRFDLVLVDEAHMIPPEGEGMYRQFLAEAKVVNPHVRVVGLTATPYRMTTGLICQPDHFLNYVCFEVGVRELIVQGYLCALRSKAGKTKIDTSNLHVRGGEFIASEVEDLMDDDELVRAACAELVELTADRKTVLVFASGVAHGRHIQTILKDGHGQECGFVCCQTPSRERAVQLERFRSGDLKYLVNVNVLTMGFDAPNVDCVAMLRPTLSPGLYYQMVGRGFRLCEGKADCLVLDFGGNVLRHGPVDAIRAPDARNGNGTAPAKECPQCQAVIHAAYARCPECGYQFPPREYTRHDAEASAAGILSGQVEDTEYAVREVAYSVHVKRDADEDHPRSMRVEYRVGFNHWQSEWVCFEHGGYARAKAESWWRQRSSEPVPATAEEAVSVCQAGGICGTAAITIRHVSGEKYDRIIGYQLGPKPPRLDGSDEVDNGRLPVAVCVDDDIPF
jgi:DNA repair protein RadD